MSTGTEPDTPPLPMLSTELWQMIFKHAFDMVVQPEGRFENQSEYLWHSKRNGDRKSTVAAVMQTCKSWYRMACPLAYQDVIVRDLASYLNGSNQPPLSAESALISKNTLLAETRYLCVVAHLHEVRWHNAQESDSRKDLEFHIAEQKMRDEASDLLTLACRRSTPMFPNLRELQLGLPNFDGHERSTSDVLIGAKLLRACRPELLCVHGTAMEYAYPNQTRAKDYNDGILPSQVITHANIGIPFSIMWGTKNWIFLMDWGDCNGYRGEGANGWSVTHQSYLERYITSSIPVWAPAKSDVFMELLRKTTIRVDGVMKSWANEEEDGIDEADQIPAIEMRILEQKIRRALQSALGGTNEDWNKVIKLTCGDDRPPCPVCGIGIFFN